MLRSGISEVRQSFPEESCPRLLWFFPSLFSRHFSHCNSGHIHLYIQYIHSRAEERRETEGGEGRRRKRGGSRYLVGGVGVPHDQFAILRRTH